MFVWDVKYTAMENRLQTIMLALTIGLTVSAQNDITAHFDMTVDGSNAITESVSGRKCTVNGVHAPENVDGAVGKALRLDGYSNYVSAEINAADMSTNVLSVSLWCAPETYPMMNAAEAENAETWIAGNLNESAHTGFAFTLTSQGDYGFKCYTGGWAVTLQAEGKMPRYEWNHLVAVIDADNRTATLYRNGEKVASSRCLSPINVGENTLFIGKSSTDRIFDNKYLLNTFNGLIDDITIYNKVLTAEEAAAPTAENTADLSIPASRFANDIMRPAFHGMPAAAWTNECHGMAYSNGKYHLFFQKNANGPYMARLHWGHIYSDNLYKWSEDRIALTPENDYDIKGCWSGAVFTDSELTDNKPAIIYTGVDNARATINMALPDDDNLTFWTKKESNPIIDGRPAGLSDDFRDPYFFTANGKKYIIVGSSKNGIGTTTLHEYNPQTGTWSNDGRTFFSGVSASRNGTFWEMPNLTKIGDKWLFTVTPLNTQSGVEVIYWTGDINSEGKFVPTSSSVDSPEKLELEGFSKDGYGLLSPTIFQHDGKTLLMGIVPDKLPSEENYKLGWAHCYSLPREVTLDSDGKLIQKPYGGLMAMRTDVKYARTDFDLSGTESLSPVSGRKYELCGEFVIGSGDFGFNLFKSGEKQVRMSYSPTDNTFTVDLTDIDRIVNDNGTYDGIYRSELPRRMQVGDVLKIHAFVDHSIMDVFINDTWAFSMRLFPKDANANDVEVFADGTTHVNKLEAWNLDENKGSSSLISAVGHDGKISVESSNGKICYTNTYDSAMLSVIDLDGRILSSKRVGAGDGTIVMRNKGMYIVKLVTPEDTFTKKLVID